jgi:hypothetical protein
MKIKFTQSGESPEVGAFEAGTVMDLPGDTARVYIERKLAEAVITVKPANKEEANV